MVGYYMLLKLFRIGIIPASRQAGFLRAPLSCALSINATNSTRFGKGVNSPRRLPKAQSTFFAVPGARLFQRALSPCGEALSSVALFLVCLL